MTGFTLFALTGLRGSPISAPPENWPSPTNGDLGPTARSNSMANNPGARKSIRKIARRTDVNKARRSRVRTFLKRFEEAVAAGDAVLAKSSFVEAQSELMRAVGKGVLHRNTGARKVSRLHAQLRALAIA